MIFTNESTNFLSRASDGFIDEELKKENFVKTNDAFSIYFHYSNEHTNQNHVKHLIAATVCSDFRLKESPNCETNYSF